MSTSILKNITILLLFLFTALNLRSNPKQASDKIVVFKGNLYFSKTMLYSHLEKIKITTLNTDECEIIIKHLLNFYLEYGFPFAKIKPALTKSANEKKLILDIEHNNYVLIDDFHFTGKLYTDPEIYKRLINLKFPIGFKESLLKEKMKILANSGLLSKTPEYSIVKRKANSWLISARLTEKHYYTFSAIGGYEGKTKDSFSGIIDFATDNLFGSYRSFNFYWERQSNNIEKNHLKYKEPWLFNTNLDLELFFLFFSQKEYSYEREYGFKLITKISENLNLGSGFSQSLLKEDINNSNIRIESNNYSLNIQKFFRNDFIHGINLQKELNITTVFHTKTRSAEINSEYQNLSILSSFRNYYPFSKYFYYLSTIKFEYLSSDTDLLQSELFKYGGTKSIRGYYERQFSSDISLISNNEYHLFFNRYNSSTIFILFDLGLMNKYFRDDDSYNLALGAGLGLNLRNESNDFKISLAANKDENFEKFKIHIGYSKKF